MRDTPFRCQWFRDCNCRESGSATASTGGATVRPLAETRLRFRTYLVSRADDDSKVASELVRAYMRKVAELEHNRRSNQDDRQLHLPLSA
jgi:hypothetical protein